ncbi:iron-sulfur cluster assembly accessory protein [Candidatus Gracilibacteria bacterium]|jgi:iron-sulfur cluster assembly protein|nr:iron-sulfur cluster assembly accessory protein [Candidatus Gracilibacteria bacterium]
MIKSSAKTKKVTYVTEEGSPVMVTEKASKFIRHMAEMSDSEPNLALKVLPGGCAGMKYSMDFINSHDVRSTDFHIDARDVQIYIDKDSMEYVSGSIMDTDDDLMSPGLKIDNPNAKRGCGCGKSFG